MRMNRYKKANTLSAPSPHPTSLHITKPSSTLLHSRRSHFRMSSKCSAFGGKVHNACKNTLLALKSGGKVLHETADQGCHVGSVLVKEGGEKIITKANEMCQEAKEVTI